MKKVTITQLKDNLSALLARAARGEEVIVFDRKKPYVRVVALYTNHEKPKGDEAEDTRLTQLEADGIVSRRKRNSLQGLLKGARPSSKASLVEALLEERDRDL
jgi:antitoxin (DNA-binding transcriptional repressor) of toxin-antitoxin stability system